jgi:Ca2+-binding EF-hand superfamily protein
MLVSDEVFLAAAAEDSTPTRDVPTMTALLCEFLRHCQVPPSPDASARILAQQCVEVAPHCPPLHGAIAVALKDAPGADDSQLETVRQWLLQFMHPRSRGGRGVETMADTAFWNYAAEGEITRESLFPALHMTGANPSQARVNELLPETSTLDVVGFRDVAAACTDTHANRDELLEAFRALDIDGNGVLDHEEFALLLQGDGEPLSDDEVKAALALADKDGDGRISLEEFVALMCEETEPLEPAITSTETDLASPAASASPGKSKQVCLGVQMDDARARSEANYRRRKGMSSERRERERQLQEEAEEAKRREEELALRRAIDGKSAKRQKDACCIVA